MRIVAVVLVSLLARGALAEEGNRQRPPLSATGGECHIVDTQPLFSEKTVGKSYARERLEDYPLTWRESFNIPEHRVRVTITHRGCEDIYSVIALRFGRKGFEADGLLSRAARVLRLLEPEEVRGPVPYDIERIVAWLEGEEARSARRIDHTDCFMRISSGECIQDAYFSSPRDNILRISSVDRP